MIIFVYTFSRMNANQNATFRTADQQASFNLLKMIEGFIGSGKVPTDEEFNKLLNLTQKSITTSKCEGTGESLFTILHDTDFYNFYDDHLDLFYHDYEGNPLDNSLDDLHEGFIKFLKKKNIKDGEIQDLVEHIGIPDDLFAEEDETESIEDQNETVLEDNDEEI